MFVASNPDINSDLGITSDKESNFERIYKEVLPLYLNRVPLREIAKHLGISRYMTIRCCEIARRHGHVWGSEKLDEKVFEKVVKLSKQNMLIREIAERLGISMSAVRRCRAKARIEALRIAKDQADDDATNFEQLKPIDWSRCKFEDVKLKRSRFG